jgi:hypothetical protein
MPKVEVEPCVCHRAFRRRPQSKHPKVSGILKNAYFVRGSFTKKEKVSYFGSDGNLHVRPLLEAPIPSPIVLP